MLTFKKFIFFCFFLNSNFKFFFLSLFLPYQIQVEKEVGKKRGRGKDIERSQVFLKAPSLFVFK